MLVRAAVRHHGILENVATILHTICRIHIDVHELRFRISLDMYIVYVGMLFGILYQELASATPSSTIWLARQVRKRPLSAQTLAVLTSFATIIAFAAFASQFADKYDYNNWHPLISPFPVLAYVSLRNANALLRICHSRVFAWLGRCSLETFILQYHIWLAADAKGLLRLGLLSDGDSTGNRFGTYVDWSHWADFLILTIFFLWTSWGVSNATNVLTEWLVGRAESRTLGLRLGFGLAALFLCNWTWE